MHPPADPARAPTGATPRESVPLRASGTESQDLAGREPWRLIVAIVGPLLAGAVQWALWAAIQPFAFVFFYPAVFFSSRLDGLRGGLVATVLSTILVWYFFVPPQLSFAVENPVAFVPMGVFAGMGVLFSFTHEQLRRMNRRSAASLVASDLKHRAALASMTDALFVSDSEGRIIELNEACATFHRFKSKAECAKAFAEDPSFPDVFAQNGDPVPVAQRAVSRALRGETATDAHYILRRKDTGETWVGSYSFAPIRDTDGSIVGSVVTGRDITESKRVEEELRKHTSLLKVAGRVARFGGWSVDLTDGRVLWSDEVAAIHETPPGFSPSVTEGINFYTPESRERISTAFGACARDGTRYDEELEIITAKGKRLWVRAVGEAIRHDSGKIVEVRGAFQDITERKRVEADLVHTRNTLLEAQRIAQLGSFEYIAATRTTVWSEEQCRIYGLDPAGPSPAYDDMLARCIHPADAPLVHATFTKAMESLAVYELEHRIVRPDGSVRWVYNRAQPYVDAQGKLVRYVGATLDITARKRLEEQQSAMDAQMRQQQKLESIGTLASGVAHEINNPITGILNYAQLMQDRLPEGSPLTEFTGEIMRETQRVATIVRNLLTFARNEKQHHSPARIADIIEAVLSLVRSVIRRDQIALHVTAPTDLPPLKCRSQQIQQVIMNLVTNARDALNERYPGYDPDKVLKLDASLLERAGRRWIRVTVEDHGTGIPPGVRDRIFDPFFTTKEREKGTGLGLSISHGIVKEHHGEWTVESEPGRFTRMHVELPVDNGWTI